MASRAVAACGVLVVLVLLAVPWRLAADGVTSLVLYPDYQDIAGMDCGTNVEGSGPGENIPISGSDPPVGQVYCGNSAGSLPEQFAFAYQKIGVGSVSAGRARVVWSYVGQTGRVSAGPWDVEYRDGAGVWRSAHHGSGGGPVDTGIFDLDATFVADAWRVRATGGTYPYDVGMALFGVYGGAQSAPDAGSSAPYTFGAEPSAAFSPDPVNLATGSFTAHADDLSLPGRVLGFSFARWYNSADPTDGPLGRGWTHSLNWLLSDNTSTVVVRHGDGRQDTFTQNADGTYADPPGVFDTLVKNADGTFTLLLPSQVLYDFSSTGKLVRISEPAGNQLALAYAAGNLATITDSVGRAITLSYDAQNRLVQLLDPLGRRVTYAYDGSGRLARVTDKIGDGAGPAAAHQWQYAYDGATRHVTTITDPDGRVRVTNTYDAQGRVTQQRDALAALTTMAYGAGQTALTDPRGHATTYTFDSRMRVVSQSDVVGASTYTIAYAYDAAGNRTSVTDRNGNRTDFAYDARGNLLTKTDPLVSGSRPLTAFAYDAKNNLTAITDPLGSLTTLSYHPTSNVLLSVSRQIDATTSAVTAYAYADAANPGMPTTVTSPKGSATTLAYDAQGNLTRRSDPDGAVTTFGYDAVGRLVSFVDPDLHTWRVSYDENDRETSRTDPLNGVLRFAYDGAGNRTGSTDRNGNTTAYAYDANTRLATVQQKPDAATTYTTTVTRDPNGNATRITQANGVFTDYAFDALDRLTSVTTHPSTGTNLVTSYILDGNGQPLTRTDGAGTTVTFAYDALSRLVSVSAPSLSIGYAYDQASRRTALTDATGTTTYQYDRLGRVTQIAAPAGTLGYAYDPDGNRTSLVYPGGQSVSYAYSPGGRLAAVTDWAARVSTYAYKPSGLVSALSFPNGRVSAYTYDDAQRLTSIDTSFSGQSLWREAYTVDAEGDRTRRDYTALGAIPATSTGYGYDGLLRLTSLVRTLTQTGTPLSSETFSLDAATNIASRTGPSAAYSYDGANRLTSDGVRSFTFDGADRLTARGSDTFSYDALSRLTSSTVTSASPGASASTLYAYDGDGLLRSRTSAGSTTGYLWDTSVGIAQLLVAGSERVVYGLGPLYRVHADGSYGVFIRDALGSVRAEVSGSGTLSNTFDYTAYGELRASLAGPPTLLGFAGELRDPSGLIYLRARWYDPGVGRFMSRDPFGGDCMDPSTLNVYSYAAGRPTLLVDASGLDPRPPGSSPVGTAPGCGLCDSLGGALKSALVGPGAYVTDIYGPRVIMNARGGIYGWIVSWGGDDNTITFGSDLIVSRVVNLDPNGPTMRHERGHVAQAKELGFAYLPTYIAEYLLVAPMVQQEFAQRGFTISAHDAHPMELDANYRVGLPIAPSLRRAQ